MQVEKDGSGTFVNVEQFGNMLTIEEARSLRDLTNRWRNRYAHLAEIPAADRLTEDEIQTLINLQVRSKAARARTARAPGGIEK